MWGEASTPFICRCETGKYPDGSFHQGVYSRAPARGSFMQLLHQFLVDVKSRFHKSHLTQRFAGCQTGVLFRAFRLFGQRLTNDTGMLPQSGVRSSFDKLRMIRQAQDERTTLPSRKNRKALNSQGLLIVANPLAPSLSNARPFVVRGSTGSPCAHHERT